MSSSPPGPHPPVALIGRSSVVMRMRALIGPASVACPALVVLGEAGIGKTAALADLTAHATSCGRRVLSATGRERESESPMAGLRQLLHPVEAELGALADQRARALLAAIGPTVAGRAPTAALAGGALLGLFGLLGENDGEPGRGLLVVIDDAQWIDRPSLDALAYAAQRLDGRPFAMTLAARGDAPPPGFDQGIQEVRIGPLTAAAARELLDAQPRPPRGPARAQVLAQSAGNPLALIELARAVAGEPAERARTGLPLPLTPRLSALFGVGLSELPAPTKDAALLAAAAESADWDAVRRVEPGLDPAVLAPAEEAGLIRVDVTGVRFRHPLIRSAVYHAASFAKRAEAHRSLASQLNGQPDRRAWHLAAAALRPTEEVASLLVATVASNQRGDGAVAAARLLERAADLSPDPASRAWRLLAAAEAAVSSGQTEWARDLAADAMALSAQPDLRALCLHVTGRALTGGGASASGARTMLVLARQLAPADAEASWNALGLAAAAVYQAGDPDSINELADTLTTLPAPTAAATRAARAWALAVAGQNAEADILLREVGPTPASEFAMRVGGATAWLRDQTADAIRLLEAARNMISDPAIRAVSGGALAALGWAYLDAGRWDDALRLAAAIGECPAADLSPASRMLLTATIEGARGNTGRARELALRSLSVDPEPNRLIAARARHSLGLCALADGDYLAAFDHLRQLFASDGTPHHRHASYLAAGDLALAAVRADRLTEGREIHKHIAARCAAGALRPSARLRQLLARATCILADPSIPDAYPDDVLSDAAGEQWPFERAQFRLEYGQWLRRQRRINQAKETLSAAHDAFSAVGARPWADQAAAELRACGISVHGAVTSASGLSALTPQQREIIELAAQGLSNREIAQRLVLSPRTVASHLHRSFPKLGVSGRRQLHALVAAANKRRPDG